MVKNLNLLKSSSLVLNTYVSDFIDLTRIKLGTFRLREENFNVQSALMEIMHIFNS